MDAVRDLGELDGPVLVFGGPCGNLEATEAVLAEARRLGIPPGRTICTGDVVAYCADPQATVDAVRGAGIPVVMGNVEESLATNSDDCGCGYVEGSTCDILSLQWFGYARAAIDDEARAWMAALPRGLRFDLGGRRLLVVHGAPSAIGRNVYGSDPDHELAREIDASGCDGVIGGHSGLPFTRIVDGRLWHNAGVVGLPANDGTPRGWYSLLSRENGGIAVELRPLDYDHAGAAAKMRARGLPEAYAEALEGGLWPDMDVLPAAERARKGIAISPRRVIWCA